MSTTEGMTAARSLHGDGPVPRNGSAEKGNLGQRWPVQLVFPVRPESARMFWFWPLTHASLWGKDDMPEGACSQTFPESVDTRCLSQNSVHAQSLEQDPRGHPGNARVGGSGVPVGTACWHGTLRPREAIYHASRVMRGAAENTQLADSLLFLPRELTLSWELIKTHGKESEDPENRAQ